MSADSEQCRKVWAALEKYPAFEVRSVQVDCVSHRWTCVVRVPWQRHGTVIETLDDVAKLAGRLEKWEAEERAAAEAAKIQAADVVLASSTVVAEYKSGERQLGLFGD